MEDKLGESRLGGDKKDETIWLDGEKSSPEISHGAFQL